MGGFHITAGKFDSISKSCVQVSWLTGGRGLDGRGVGSRAEAWAQLAGVAIGSVCAEESRWNRSEQNHRMRNGVGGSRAAGVGICSRERRDAEMGETQETAALQVPPRAVYVHS